MFSMFADMKCLTGCESQSGTFKEPSQGRKEKHLVMAVILLISSLDKQELHISFGQCCAKKAAETIRSQND